MRQHWLRRCRGFSLVEILIVFAILGLLMAVAVPMTRRWMGNREVSEAGDRLLADLRETQTSAIAAGVDVTFSGSATGGVTDGYCVWRDGRKVATRPLHPYTNVRMAGNFNQTGGATAGTNVIFYRNGAAVGGFGYLANGYVVNATGGSGVGGEIILDNGGRAMRIRLTRSGAATLDQVNVGTTASNI